MEVVGAPWSDFLSVELFLNTVLDAITQAWGQIPRPPGSAFEDDITRRLYLKIKEVAALRALPLRVYCALPIVDEETLAEDIPDLQFETNGPQWSSELLCVECKRVRIPGPASDCASNNAAYVDGNGQGMLAFVSRRYPAPHGHACMIGYFLCACDNAIGSLDSLISDKRDPLALLAPHKLGRSPIFEHASAYETSHDVAGSGILRIQHLLLDVQECGSPIDGAYPDRSSRPKKTRARVPRKKPAT